MRTRKAAAPPETPEQAELFGGIVESQAATRPQRSPARAGDAQGAASRWRMPELEGATVAEVRLRWSKRLTPAQKARVEAEIEALPKLLEGLGYGPVEMERSFVRRRRKP